MATSNPKTGIKVVIVGAGFGGLATALECHRQGHDVEIYEKFAEYKIIGDMIGFGSNSGRIVHQWGKYPGEVVERLRPLMFDSTDYGIHIHKVDTGEVVLYQKDTEKIPRAPVIIGHRGQLHQVIFDYAKNDVGIPIHLGQDVNEYFEDGNQAGIVLKSGERILADVVVGSDGVRSKARDLVLGYEDKPKGSGYAVWRAMYVRISRTWELITLINCNTDDICRYFSDALSKDPLTKGFCGVGDTFDIWIGRHAHFLCFTKNNGEYCAWSLTHKDDHNIDE